MSTSDDLAVTSGVSTLTPLFKLKNLVEYSQNSGKHFPYYHQFIIIDTKEWPDEGVRWVSSGWNPSTGASVPMHWVLPPSLQVNVLSNSEGLCALLFTGVLWRFHHWLSHWHLVSALNFQSLFCLKSLGGSIWIFHLSSHMVGSSGNQLPSWSSLGAHPGHLINKYSDMINKRLLWKTIKYFKHF